VAGLELDHLYRTCGPMMLRRARTLLGDEQLARDALHDVFMRAMNSADGFRGDASPMTWLYRVITNHCLNVIRDRARRAELLASDQRLTPSAAHASPEDRLAVSTVLAQLPEELREIAVYYFVDQMNREEIANMLGVSLRTVGHRLERFQVMSRAIVGPLREAAR
jgi:RNA polymerase sigma factor (sigma-70 family)